LQNDLSWLQKRLQGSGAPLIIDAGLGPGQAAALRQRFNPR
jgi:hypothetical protein